MLREGPKFLHWNYFIALESDLERLSRYVEFTKDNYKTYSMEMAHLLLAAGSEVDVVLKGLCKKVQQNSKADNIEQYREILSSKIPKLNKMKIKIHRYNLEIEPWDNWQRNITPDWWHAYNEVKHQRDKYFHKAKLQYTVAAIAGLFVAALYLYKEEAENGFLTPFPKLLSPPPNCIGNLIKTEFGVSLCFRL
jgi:hypothetical protein